MTTLIRDNELSPIYLKLYREVAECPAMLNIREGILKAIRETSCAQYSYERHNYWKDKITVKPHLLVGPEIVETSFELRGDEAPSCHLKTDHLVHEEELLKIFFENVGREGKPIKQHGLVQRDTIMSGASPRGKNQFVPWMVSNLIHSDEFCRVLTQTVNRLGREIMTTLQADSVFQQFAENIAMDAIVEKLSDYAYLPPEVLHRGVDLMYVQATMEK
jgi:hypothetical protein